MVNETPQHIPVMPDEVVAQLAPRPGEVVLDCTLGRAGHAQLIMPMIAPGGRYIGLDVDPANLAYARDAVDSPPVPMELVHRNFAEAGDVLDELEVDGVDLLLADLGFASTQVDDPGRGLSFLQDGPLDMRLDPTIGRTAADLVNRTPQNELADLIYRYGDERFSRAISRKIVERRRRTPINTTSELAELCCAVYGPRARRQRIHPATRTFQALRIAVNDELGRLEALLGAMGRLLKPDARAVIISFHSLEDRAVKQAFRRFASDGLAELLVSKPLRPSDEERHANSRSRSARLRALRWLAARGRASS